MEDGTRVSYKDWAKDSRLRSARDGRSAQAASDRRCCSSRMQAIAASAHASSRLIRDAVLKVYKGGPHGVLDTHKDQVNPDIPEFIRK